MAHLPISAESPGFAPAYQSVESVISADLRKRPPTKTSGQGRPKGSPNKITTDLKEMILGALHDEGGRAYLRKQAVANPTAFMSLVGKVLPTTLVGDPKRPIVVSVNEEERRREVDAAIDAVFGVTNNVSNMVDVSNAAAEIVTNTVANMIEHELVSNTVEHEADPDWPYHCEVCRARLSTDRSRCRAHAIEQNVYTQLRDTIEAQHELAEAASAANGPGDGGNAEPDDKIVQLPHTKPHI